MWAESVKRSKRAKPIAPNGFTVDLVASGLAGPCVIRVAPNGDLFVSDSEANTIRVYRVASGSARPVKSEVYASGLNKPFGIAFYPVGPNPEWVYVANTDGVVRFPYTSGDLKASGKPEEIVEKIPSTHHWTRDLVFSPDGKRMFLAVGSGSNVAQDMFPEPQIEGGLKAWKKTKPLGAAWDTEERRADVLSFTPEGKDEKIFATGLRNCAGLTVQPATGELWCAVDERDEIGDDAPLEYATHIKEGAFYGWPWFYTGGNEDPHHKGARPDLKDKVTVPDVLIEAHSAPLQIAFYDGDSFPTEYKGDAFVTLHGSWIQGQRSGNKVVRLRFKDGKPTGEYEDFLTGFVVSNEKAWGRPVGIAVGQDGALFVTEDGSGSIWRVSYGNAGTTAETNRRLANLAMTRSGSRPMTINRLCLSEILCTPVPRRRKRLQLRVSFRLYSGVMQRSLQLRPNAPRRFPRSSSITSRSPLSSKDFAARLRPSSLKLLAATRELSLIRRLS